MEDVKVQIAGQNESDTDAIDSKDVKGLKDILARFIKEYGKKPADLSDEAWLKQRFMEEIPGLSEAEAEALGKETVASIHEYDNNLASLKAAREKGRTSEEWFAEKAQEAASGLSAIEFGKELAELDSALLYANTEMTEAVCTKNWTINQGSNLDGFIAEQQHVNTFNLAAATAGSPYHAEVCTPEPGQTYGKNSFDVVIKDQKGHIVHQYQFKYGKDAQSTIAMLKNGNYNNQTLVVPPEQVEAVQAAFPGKTVVSQIGGTEKVPVSSKPLSKAEAKAMQEHAQNNREIPTVDWDSFDSRMLAKHIGKQAAFAGIQGAVLTAGFSMAAKLAADEPIEPEEVVSTALVTGADAGIKSAAAGAVKVASEKGILKIVPKGTPMGPIVNVVCVAIENIKILARVAKGEITFGEALDLMGCNTVAMTFGLKWGTAGMGVGLLALGWIPVVGPIVGGVVGGVIGYMGGSKFGETIYHTAKKVAEAAKEATKKVFEAGKELIGGILSRAKLLLGITY